MRPRAREKNPISEEITWENFTHSSPDRNSRIRFMRLHPGEHVMIRPDRLGDKDASRYQSDEERRAGDAAMMAWFEYLAFKARDDRRFLNVFKGMRSMLKAGQSIMVVCADPTEFDQAYIPAHPPILSPDFWRDWHMDRARPYQDGESRSRVIAGLKEIFRAIGHP